MAPKESHRKHRRSLDVAKITPLVLLLLLLSSLFLCFYTPILLPWWLYKSHMQHTRQLHYIMSVVSLPLLDCFVARALSPSVEEMGDSTDFSIFQTWGFYVIDGCFMVAYHWWWFGDFSNGLTLKTREIQHQKCFSVWAYLRMQWWSLGRPKRSNKNGDWKIRKEGLFYCTNRTGI